jgi:hypothetical protein
MDNAWEHFKGMWADGVHTNQQLLAEAVFRKLEGSELKSEDAQKVIEILLTADNDCIHCARKLCEKFVTVFPDHKNQVEAMFRAKFDKTLGEVHGYSLKVGTRPGPDKPQDQQPV